MTVWRDNHPDRYGPIEDGGYCVITDPDGSKHFILLRFGTEAYPGHYEMILGGWYACGREVADYRDRATRLKMPMGGVVDCPGCLRAMEADA